MSKVGGEVATRPVAGRSCYAGKRSSYLFIMTNASFPCPCCGYLVFSEPPGSFQLCPICGWEDDALQLQYPEEAGTNPVPLIEAQQNYQRTGAIAAGVQATVRKPYEDERRDDGWHPLSRHGGSLPRFEAWEKLAEDGPQSETDLYYWRPESWAKRQGMNA